MDGPFVEHSDSDSGESWTMLENNSVYADEPPEFIEDHESRQEAQHEKDEDTDGISIISDSDHDTPSPLPDETINDKYQIQENGLSKKDVSEYVSVDPQLSNIDNDDHIDPAISEDFLGDSHARHKTYVHKRNKRLSTVLNIIVLGSVITAAGIAIGHMWGAKYDCTMQSTSSVNKILSNLYKLQEENAYLRAKLKELAFSNNHQMEHHKLPLKNNKCKKVFEESLNNNEPRKFTKCVDENYNNANVLTDHLTKPKFEKEFIADIDKLKTVYLQNKSWLDDEISRRMKIEEELLKKYNDEVNSDKEQKKVSVAEDTDTGFELPFIEIKKEETLDNIADLKSMDTDMFLQNKVTYTDSLQPEHKPRFKRNDDQYATDERLTLKQNEINNFDEDNKRNPKSNQAEPDQETKLDLNDGTYAIHHDNNLSESLQKFSKNIEEHYVHDEDWIEVKPKFQHIKERYDAHHGRSFIDKREETINHSEEQGTPHIDVSEEDPQLTRNEDDKWSRYAQEAKKIRKKENHDDKKNTSKQNSDTGKKNEDRISDYSTNPEEMFKDVNNKLKQQKKRNAHINSNKKQKRKNRHEKTNMKGEFGEKFDSVINPESYSDKKRNLDRESFFKNIDDNDKTSNSYTNFKDKPGKVLDREGKFGKKTDGEEQNANWFEKRAAFRTEARKKYEEFRETSPNNSSWYFRRMRKREQCRAKGDNRPFRKVQKEKKNQKMKY